MTTRTDLIDGRKIVDFTDSVSQWLLSRHGGTDWIGQYIEQFELLRGDAPAVLITYHDEDQFEAWRLGLAPMATLRVHDLGQNLELMRNMPRARTRQSLRIF